LASSLAISDFSNTIPRSGEFPMWKTTMISIREEIKKLRPLHIERNLEPVFSIFEVLLIVFISILQTRTQFPLD